METYLSPNSMLCAWRTPEDDTKISSISRERVDCSDQIVQRRKQMMFFEEELSTLKILSPVIDQFEYFQRFMFIKNVNQQANSISTRNSLSIQTFARSSDGSKQQ